MASEDLNVAEMLVASLRDFGITTVFALPGEENLHVVEALRESDMDVIVTRHEQQAAFMAATVGRLTSTPGVCLATLGPGATNLFTGLAHAKLGGYPMIAITGQKPALDNEEGSFQMLDVVASARPLVKAAVSVRDPLSAPSQIASALRTSVTGRPGPVLIELPEDVAAAASAPSRHTAVPDAAAPSARAIAAAVDLIDRATQPVFMVSEHANRPDISSALTKCATATGIGVVATQLGKGAIDESHPLAVGSLGIHRPDYIHHPVFAADLIIAVGYDPVEHPPLSWNPDDDTTIIHVAAWPAAIERGYSPVLDLVGDIATSLDRLAGAVAARNSEAAQRQAVQVRTLLDDEPAGTGDAVPSPLDVVRCVRKALDADAVVALDNGAYKVWFARHYPASGPQTLLLDNALATMGAGLAIGMTAALLHPERRVVTVCGDGGFLMNVQDLETAVRLGIDLTIVVLRDDTYGFIAWHQDEQDLPRFAVEVGNPDLAALASAFGATSCTATTNDELRQALADAGRSSGVQIIDCLLDYGINDLLDDDLFAQSRSAFDASGGIPLVSREPEPGTDPGRTESDSDRRKRSR